MPPPFNINDTSPAASDIISAYPANEQANRALIEEWLTYISDPTTGLIKASALPTSAILPSGTAALFAQTSAPTGWTKSVAHNNKALRVVSGTAASGGSVAFTTAFASQAVVGTTDSTVAAGSISNTVAGGTVDAHTLTPTEMPLHTHSQSNMSGTTSTDGDHYHFIMMHNGVAGSSDVVGRVANYTPFYRSVDTATGQKYIQNAGDHSHTVTVTGGNTGSAGSNGSHTHGFTGASHGHTFTGNAHSHTFTGTAINLAVQYVDVIIATKD